MNIQPFVIFSLIAAFSFAFSQIASKFTSKHAIKDPLTLLFYQAICFLPFLIIYPLLFHISFPVSGLIYIVLYAVAFFLGNIFFTRAIYKLDISSIAPFFQLQTALIAIMAFIFLHERFPPVNYFYISVMIAGSVLVSIDENMSIKSYLKVGILFIVMQQILHASSNIFAGLGLKTMNQFTFIFWGDLLAALMVIIIIPIKGISALTIKFAQLKPLLLGGFFSTVGATSLFTAFQSNITLSSVLSLLTSPIVFIISVAASKYYPGLLEHHTKKVYLIRATGVSMILAGALKLSSV